MPPPKLGSTRMFVMRCFFANPEERHQRGVVVAAEEAAARHEEQSSVKELQAGVCSLVLAASAGVDEHDVALVGSAVLRDPHRGMIAVP